MVKFDHMNMPVSDPFASRDWYVKTFGFKVEFEVPERRTVALQDDAGFTIFFYPAAKPLDGAKCSLTLQVENVDDIYAKLSQRGVKFSAGPGKYFWGYGAELLDPDGYQLLLWDEVTMREKGR
jgi:catechol 2,3-dioxygenase-like lactoylglutathione lyase family enzyme